MDTNKFIDLIADKGLYSNLELEYIKRTPSSLRVINVDFSTLIDNLEIGIASSFQTRLNVESLKVLHNKIADLVNPEILSVKITMPNSGLKTVYVSTDLKAYYGTL